MIKTTKKSKIIKLDWRECQEALPKRLSNLPTAMSGYTYRLHETMCEMGLYLHHDKPHIEKMEIEIDLTKEMPHLLTRVKIGGKVYQNETHIQPHWPSWCKQVI